MNPFQLKQISESKSHKIEKELLDLQVRESNLRDKLAWLKDLAYQTHQQPATDTELRAIGGDIIWLSWIADQRRQMNIELAKILAKKETIMRDYKAAVGRKLVSENIFETYTKTTKKETQRNRLNDTLETILVHRLISNPGEQSPR